MTAIKITSRAVVGRLVRALQQGTGVTWPEQLGMYVQSNQELEEYAWLGNAPAMREWKGGRHAKGLREFSMTIRNLPYEATLVVEKAWMDRDKLGVIDLRIAELAKRANSHWAKLLTTLIENGESTACYDGQYFFDTDHAEGNSGSQSNDISVDISALAVTNHGSTTAPSVAELQQSILQGCQKIIGFKDDEGEPMNEDARNFTVMVPTSYWMTAAAALGAPVIDSGDTNVVKAASMDGFNISMVVNPRLTWTEKFAVFQTDDAVKPFVRQEEKGVEVSSQAEGSAIEFEKRQHHHGIFTSRNVGYGYWQKACLVTLA